MSILSMAEQQQHLAVDVTLHLLQNVFDKPFFVFKLTNG
jgi:hypothetical protein